MTKGKHTINVGYFYDYDCPSHTVSGREKIRTQFVDSNNNHNITIATATPTTTNYIGIILCEAL